ncbi:MAG: manganese efflux pump MntP family protein [Bacteroidota bacterium]|nr:manganese efflux pump MntP family protein [Bacteroidota bacterium]
MNLFDIVTIAVGLAMDCLAVSIACGIIFKRVQPWPFFRIAFFFGLFQGVMPLIGWYAGSTFSRYISGVDHWIAFVILLILGGKMIVEYIKGDDQTKKTLDPWKLSVVLTLALATSIDALAVGISFAFLNFQPYLSALIIGSITFFISLLGLLAGCTIGNKIRIPAELVGGIVLIGIGVKILIQHLFS